MEHDTGQTGDQATDPIAWHPAFIEAMQMELDHYVHCEPLSPKPAGSSPEQKKLPG